MDVIKLEGTSVVRGIDMNAVWEQMCKQMLSRITGCPFEIGSYFHFEGSWKERYFSVLTSLLLNLFKADHRYRRCASDFLFTMLFGFHHHCTFVESEPDLDLSHPVHRFPCFMARRYSSLYTYDEIVYDSDDSDGSDSPDNTDALSTPTKMASYLIEKCRYRPKLVYISCSLFFYSPFWTKKESLDVSSTLRDFLSDTRQVVFSNDNEMIEISFKDDEYHYRHYHEVSRYVMEVILCSNSPKLESVLTTRDCLWIADQVISNICELFIGLNFGDSDSDTSTLKESLVKHVPYKHLKRICFITGASESDYRDIDCSTAERLDLAVRAQITLESVQLDGWPCAEHLMEVERWCPRRKEFTHLFSTLASLFKQPQFQNLELQDTSLFLPTLQEILHTFFTTLSPNHQNLKLGAVRAYNFDGLPGTFPIPDTSETPRNKSLHLSNLRLSSKEETLIFSYPLLNLESLSLMNLTSEYPTVPKSLTMAAAVLLRVNNSSHLKKLILKDIIFLHPNPQSVVSLLLRSPCLSHLEIEHCDIGPGGLITGLSHELPNCSSLHDLKLVRLDLGGQSEEQLQQLCNIIFSLVPQVTNFTLDLSSNDLAERHFGIIVNSWKHKSPGRKLKELTVSEKGLEPDLLPLAVIAWSVVYQNQCCDEESDAY